MIKYTYQSMFITSANFESQINIKGARGLRVHTIIPLPRPKGCGHHDYEVIFEQITGSNEL